ncbi:tRNA(Ile)-lysidine synthetase [Chlamydia trachomatis]|nr:tRNA(Ile)-lysidine synthetase [Chlamydia trachomatis]
MKKTDFLKVVEKNHFFDQHAKVLVAVSGGKDSLNLFHLLFDLRHDLNIELGMIHVNHQQRPESQEEERYLASLAREFGIPFFVDYFSEKFSEAKAREFRYEFFKKIMIQEDYTALVTAHHADDQAETIFMRILRGNILRNLEGIEAVQPFGAGQLIRPLLSFKKSDLADIFHFEDSSNASQHYFRNRVRNTYLPLLEKENPRFSTALIELGDETMQLFTALRDLTNEIIVTNCQEFLNQTPAVQYFLLQEYVAQFPDLQLTKAQFREVLAILQSKKTYQHFLKNGYYLLKTETEFSITKIIPETDENYHHLVIKSEGIYHYKDLVIGVDVPLEGTQQILYLKKEFPIILRSRQAGDKILLNGVRKKLRRYFIDEKIPQEKRQKATIVEQCENIYGIANIVASDLSKSTKNGTINVTLYIKMKV